MKFTFENLQSKRVTLVIEPWAMAEDVEPEGTVVFEVSDQPAPEIHFGMTRDGDPCISVVSDVVRFRAGGQDWEFA